MEDREDEALNLEEEEKRRIDEENAFMDQFFLTAE